MSPFVYLASQSPRRQELLTQIGVAYRLLVAEAPEDTESLETPLPREPALRYVQRVTLLKCQAAEQRLLQRGLPHALILCADTTVTLRGEILGKPRDAHDAARMLRRLAGQIHRVFTAVVISDGTRRELALSASRVQLRPLRESEISAYIATQEAFGKAGAYALQGRAAIFIERISGSHSGIVGLPLFETAELLRRFDFPLL